MLLRCFAQLNMVTIKACDMGSDVMLDSELRQNIYNLIFNFRYIIYRQNLI